MIPLNSLDEAIALACVQIDLEVIKLNLRSFLDEVNAKAMQAGEDALDEQGGPTG